MADGVVISVRGIPDVKAALNAMAADLRRTVVRGALRSASRPLIASAKSSTLFKDFAGRRRAAGTVRRNIRVFNSKRANGAGGVLGVFVTVKASKQDLKRAPVTGDPYYWRWVEGGHKIVARFKGKYTDYKKRGRGRLTGLVKRRHASTTSVAPRPFLLTAFRLKGGEAIRIFSDQILARIAQTNKAK